MLTPRETPRRILRLMRQICASQNCLQRANATKSETNAKRSKIFKKSQNTFSCVQTSKTQQKRSIFPLNSRFTPSITRSQLNYHHINHSNTSFQRINCEEIPFGILWLHSFYQDYSVILPLNTVQCGFSFSLFRTKVGKGHTFATNTSRGTTKNLAFFNRAKAFYFSLKSS
jgi:hypothetical protein